VIPHVLVIIGIRGFHVSCQGDADVGAGDAGGVSVGVVLGVEVGVVFVGVLGVGVVIVGAVGADIGGVVRVEEEAGAIIFSLVGLDAGLVGGALLGAEFGGGVAVAGIRGSAVACAGGGIFSGLVAGVVEAVPVADEEPAEAAGAGFDDVPWVEGVEEGIDAEGSAEVFGFVAA
jgi:hypothetical protein